MARAKLIPGLESSPPAPVPVSRTHLRTSDPDEAAPAIAGLSHLLELAPPRVVPGYVRRAEEYITAHAGEAITLADIVDAAGASARSLQAAFRALRGMTPMGFLKVQRLERAHRQLLAPTPKTTVAAVANATGFSSPGRFSVEYRKLFHESPSETLSSGRSAGRRRRR